MPRIDLFIRLNEFNEGIQKFINIDGKYCLAHASMRLLQNVFYIIRHAAGAGQDPDGLLVFKSDSELIQSSYAAADIYYGIRRPGQKKVSSSVFKAGIYNEVVIINRQTVRLEMRRLGRG